MNNRIFVAFFLSLFGLLGLINGIVMLVKKQYFAVGLQNKEFFVPALIRNISGKKAKFDGVGFVIAGLFFLGFGVALYFWGS